MVDRTRDWNKVLRVTSPWLSWGGGCALNKQSAGYSVHRCPWGLVHDVTHLLLFESLIHITIGGSPDKCIYKAVNHLNVDQENPVFEFKRDET